MAKLTSFRPCRGDKRARAGQQLEADASRLQAFDELDRFEQRPAQPG
jgi:hypothetical protein